MMEEIPAPDEGEMILIDKALTWTSFDVVRKLKRACKFKKIGHAGTLDPLATGLLILCTGRMTKRIDQYQAQEKEYEGTLVLGKTTPSVDLETVFDQEYPFDHITPEKIDEAAKKLTGTLQQLPPMYSAVQVGGERLYKKARRGETIEVKPREVQVSLFTTDSTRFPEVDFRIICSKGTYIRSLVRDFGQLLDSGAYLMALRRTRIGEYTLDEAHDLEAYIQKKRGELGLSQ